MTPIPVNLATEDELSEVILQDHWNIRHAARNSPSLAKAVDRLASFEPVWS
jgi:hypothetical protein